MKSELALPPRKRPFGIYIGAIFLLFAGVGVGATTANFWREEPTKEAEEEATAPLDHLTITLDAEQQKSSKIVTQQITPQPLERVSWRTGHIAVNEDRVAHLSPPVEGIIHSVPVRLGQTVNAGDTLAVIDSREFSFLKLELVKARAALITEKENTERIQTITTNAAELVKLLTTDAPLTTIDKKLTDKPIGEWRSQLLGAYTKRNQLKAQLASSRSSAGALPESTILKTEAEYEAAEASYIALIEEVRYQIRYQVRQADIKLREAQTTVDITKAKLLTFGLTPTEVDTVDPIAEGTKASLLTLKAPFAGTIVEKHAVQSERVGPTFQMFVLTDLSNVWVQADIFESDLPMVSGLTGKTIRFRSPNAGVTEQSAKVISTGSLIDKGSRALTLTAEAENKGGSLKPGTFVEVGFNTGTATPTLQIPLSAVFRIDNAPFVFVALEDNKFKRRMVTLGRESDGQVEVIEGIKTNDRVVVQGTLELKSEMFKDLMAGE